MTKTAEQCAEQLAAELRTRLLRHETLTLTLTFREAIYHIERTVPGHPALEMSLAVPLHRIAELAGPAARTVADALERARGAHG